MSETEERLEAALDIVLDLCASVCWDERKQVYSSKAISDYAFVLKFLAKENKLKIIYERGRVVEAVPVEHVTVREKA